MLFALSVYFAQRTASLPFGPFWLRKLLGDYSFAIMAVWWTGFSHMYMIPHQFDSLRADLWTLHRPGYITSAGIERLPITKSFFPSTEYVYESQLVCVLLADLQLAI